MNPQTHMERVKMLFLVRHAESIENATKYTGFYDNPRPWTGPAAHALSRDVVGLTPRGFLQCLWLRQTLGDLTGPDPVIRTSQYRRAIDTAALALPGLPVEATALLNEQHYGAATYMTKEELYATYPEGTQDRQTRKHLWTPPGADGESSPSASYAGPRRSSTACTRRQRRMSSRSRTTPRSSRCAQYWSAVQ